LSRGNQDFPGRICHLLPSLFEAACQAIEEIPSIPVVYEYLSTLYPPDHDVMQHTGRLQPSLSWHGISLAQNPAHHKLMFLPVLSLSPTSICTNALKHVRCKCFRARFDVFSPPTRASTHPFHEGNSPFHPAVLWLKRPFIALSSPFTCLKVSHLPNRGPLPWHES